MNKRIQKLLLRLKMLWVRIFIWRPLIKQTYNPRELQVKVLKRILQANQNTIYGKQYGFNDIKSVTQFQNALPVTQYEGLRSFIDKQETQSKPYLNYTQPVLYAQTSGTVAQPKLIPILDSTIKQFKRSQQSVAYAQYADIEGVFDGKILAIVSPAVEGHLPSGTPYGSMSGLIYRSMPKFAQSKYVVPAEIFEIDNYEKKYFLIAAFALAQEDISMIGTANPSTLLKLAEVMNTHFSELFEEVRCGNTYGLKPNPQRAKRLMEIQRFAGKISFSDCWPSLKSVTTWTKGSCAVLIPNLCKQLGSRTRIVEMGYLSSEFRGSIPVDVLGGRCMLTINENFYEFAHCDAWENGDTRLMGIEDLKVGENYYIFVTTPNGLYRYCIDDIIQVDGFYNRTPTISFVQKGKGITNLTGEKLYESQVNIAMEKVQIAFSLELNFFVLMADSAACAYTLYVESDRMKQVVVDYFELELAKINMEFEAKRASGRLRPTRLVQLNSGTAERYKQHCIDGGQREGQFKYLKLQSADNCQFDFAACASRVANAA